MIKDISNQLRELVSSYNPKDKIIFKNKMLEVNTAHFETIVPVSDNQKSITYIDGGQAEILNAGNFCLSFIRIFAVRFQGTVKQDLRQHEFYLLTSAKNSDGEIYYYSKMFTTEGEKLIDENMLTISSQDSSIKTGIERAPIQKVANIARRFCELELAKKLSQENFSNYLLLDGTLEPTFNGEDNIIANLPDNVCALAKTSCLFTQQGNNPIVLFNQISPTGLWSYHLEGKTYFVKLHENSKHIFRFEGRREVLSEVVSNCLDPIFLGYPYGLIFADKMARVTNQEKDSLRMTILLNKENKDLLKYLSSSNAHEILDSIG